MTKKKKPILAKEAPKRVEEREALLRMFNFVIEYTEQQECMMPIEASYVGGDLMINVLPFGPEGEKISLAVLCTHEEVFEHTLTEIQDFVRTFMAEANQAEAADEYESYILSVMLPQISQRIAYQQLAINNKYMDDLLGLDLDLDIEDDESQTNGEPDNGNLKLVAKLHNKTVN